MPQLRSSSKLALVYDQQGAFSRLEGSAKDWRAHCGYNIELDARHRIWVTSGMGVRKRGRRADIQKLIGWE